MKKENERWSAASIGGNARYSVATERARAREREREKERGEGASSRECLVLRGAHSPREHRARVKLDLLCAFINIPRAGNPLYFQGIRVAGSLTKGRERLLIGRDPWEFFNIRVALLARDLLPALFTTHT
jgi:hypothetical protein